MLTIKDKCVNSWEQKQLSKSPTNKPREDCLKPLFFAEAGKKKSSEILEFQSFALICYLLFAVRTVL